MDKMHSYICCCHRNLCLLLGWDYFGLNEFAFGSMTESSWVGGLVWKDPFMALNASPVLDASAYGQNFSTLPSYSEK